MLYGIALQAATNTARGTAMVQQTIVVPAAGVSFSRLITEHHPRRQWRQCGFSMDESVWQNHRVTQELRTTSWEDRNLRALSDWHLTTDVPVLFHIKDDEAVEMMGGSLPRNVALRYQRAIEAHEAVLIGAHAKPLLDVIGALEEKHAAATTTMSKAPGTTLGERLVKVLDLLNEAIKADKTALLDNYTPKVARAKGGGAHRNHDRLPAKSDVYAAAPVAAPAPAPVAAPVVEGAVVKPGDVLIRPNGQPYMCREVRDLDIKGGISDVQLFRTVAANGIHTMLWGLPGTGKTAGLEIAFPGMVNMLGTPETEADDFYGGYVAVLGEDGREVLHWQDGPLTIAFENGLHLFVDEIGLIPSNQIAPLLGVLDGRTEFRIPQNPARGVIKRKEGFSVSCAFNPSTARHVSEALISRFGLKIEHSTDFGAARAMGCNARLVDAAEHMNKQVETGELGWAPQMRELLQARDDEALFGIVYALRNLAMNAPDMERDLVIGHLKERFGDIPGANRKIKALRV